MEKFIKKFGLQVVFAVWTILLVSVAIFGNNPYVNGIILFFGFIGVITALAFVCEAIEKDEKASAKMEKLASKIFD